MNSEQFLHSAYEAACKRTLPEFMRERHQQLQHESYPITYVAANHKLSRLYIHEMSTIQSYPLTKGFSINDPTAVDMFSRCAVETYQRLIDKDSADVIVTKAAQLAINRYFAQPPIVNSLASKQRRLLHQPNIGILPKRPQNLALLAHSGYAMCSEQAAASHNWCLLGGVPSYFITCQVKESQEAHYEGHALQLVREEGSDKLFDPTLYGVVRSEVGQEIVRAIEKVNVNEFLGGKPTTITVSQDGVPGDERTMEYLFSPQYPASFEAYDKTTFIIRALWHSSNEPTSTLNAKGHQSALHYFHEMNLQHPDTSTKLLTNGG